MIRQAQIKKAAFEYADAELIGIIDSKKEAAFIEGAEWADRTMIEKACEWLQVELDKEEELHYIHVHGFDKERREIFLEDFKKAMKGD